VAYLLGYAGGYADAQKEPTDPDVSGSVTAVVSAASVTSVITPAP
jgi:hypothetical protein